MAAIIVAIVVSACGARGVEPAGDGSTPTSPAPVESTIETTTVTTEVAPSDAPTMTEAELVELESEVAEIERLAIELEELVDEPVAP